MRYTSLPLRALVLTLTDDNCGLRFVFLLIIRIEVTNIFRYNTRDDTSSGYKGMLHAF